MIESLLKTAITALNVFRSDEGKYWKKNSKKG